MPRDDDSITITLPAPKTRTASPRLICQANAPSVTGQTSSIFLASLTAYEAAGGRVARRGKGRWVDADHYVAWWMTGVETTQPEDSDPATDLAKELGLEVAH